MIRLLVTLLLGQLLAVCVPTALSAAPTPTYREPWRPQFHFTPAVNWMNDPNGMVYYEGEYHLFFQYNPFGEKWGHMSWAHAVSRDLVHWEHLPVALKEENGVMIFSGSAVVDWRNTSGFGKNGKPPMVAIYTGHYTQRPLQNQQIAYSNDRGRTWTRYAGNPVLDLGEADFRDPKVFWYEPTQRWIMAVSWPVHRQVRLYASPNLKDWTHLSDFGPAGSTQGIWECPDLFPIPMERAGGPQKWVLVVNVGSGAPAGGSGCQYFVGNFDGRNFTLDPSFPEPTPEFVPEGRVLADFEGGDYSGWQATGNAFGTAPVGGKMGGQQAVAGFRGKGLVNTFRDGDAAEGTLTSPEFEVTHPQLSFLIGGGNHSGKTCVNLIVDGAIVRTATGDNAERLAWKSWDIRALRGKRAVLEIVDHHTGGWGHINVDHFLLSGTAARPAAQPALWADWARDFYAAVSWSDVPKRDGRRLWLGWMSNWEYANDVPTSPWRSAMSIPRELALRNTPSGWRMIQRPVREMNALRGRHERLAFRGMTGSADFSKLSQTTSDLFECTADLRPSADARFEFTLRTGSAEETVVRVDVAAGELVLDRTRSGNTGFHAAFSGTYRAPIRCIDGVIKLRFFVDTSSVEIFANDGEAVLTSLILPSAGPREFGLHVRRGALERARVDVWKLRSAWAPAP